MMKLQQISQVINRALAAAGLRAPDARVPSPAHAAATWAELLKELRRSRHADGSSAAQTVSDFAPHPAAEARPAAPHGPGDSTPPTGKLVQRSFSNAHGTRDFLLYVPARRVANAPLVLMLHGCKQDPADFARGTQINELAERHGFLVACPAQTARENGANCWNWFEPSQQTRAGAEPSILAGIASELIRTQSVDPSRVFVAGLSAGAAMALILGAAYPDVFRAVAAHSGLPVGAANGVSSAFTAMRGRPFPLLPSVAAVPTFVIHGDADSTVDRGNGEAIVSQVAQAYERSGVMLEKQRQEPRTYGGREVTVTTFAEPGGKRRLEQWEVAGGAHTWFGGNPRGSYTDARGPDASTEIIRFFLSQAARS